MSRVLLVTNDFPPRPGGIQSYLGEFVDRLVRGGSHSVTVYAPQWKGADAFDVLRATFPAGTVSGAPKIRAMEIIDELEPHQRGIYGGAVGYVSFTGNLDMAIAIRTLVTKGDTVYLQAGAGIVADSDPDAEYEETLNKARAVVRALAMARPGR